MDNYLIDREILGQFVDELIKQKALPVDSPEELNTLREEAIKNLDEAIGVAIFSKLTKEQYAKFDRLSSDPNTTEDAYDAFFKDAGLDISQIVTDAVKDFGAEFLKGEQNE